VGVWYLALGVRNTAHVLYTNIEYNYAVKKTNKPTADLT